MEENEQILKELRKANKLLSVIVLKDLTESERISLLARAGFEPKEIAELTGKNPVTVRTTLHRSRNRK